MVAGARQKTGEVCTMSLNTRVSEDGTHVTVRIGQRFDFNVHREFRDAYKGISGLDVEFTVDLSDTEYMDSSALGMLLLLREHLGGERARISVVNCREGIKKVLLISNFHKLFNIQ